MALTELVLKSLKNEKLELEAFEGESSRKDILDSCKESIAVVLSGDIKGFYSIMRVIVEHAYYMGYQRGKSESPDAKKLEDLLGGVDLGGLDK